MESVKRKNAVAIRNMAQKQQRIEFMVRQDPYIVEIDQGKNYYNYGSFEHLAYYCCN